MLAAIVGWVSAFVTSVHARYGVDPRAYLVVWLISAPLFWVGFGLLVRSFRKRNRGGVILYSGLSLLLNQSPTIYLAAFGRDLPWWVWSGVALLAAWGIAALVLRIRRARSSASAREWRRPPTVSVVIPTLNEEPWLPRLLDSLRRQEYPVAEVVVADGFSRDRTRLIAAERGCRVVDGPGHPGVGRNRGAAVATGELLLFLDADVVLPRGFLRRFVERFEAAGAASATSIYHPDPPAAFTRISMFVANVFIYCIQRAFPMAAGYCIMIRRDVFAAVGGFDEELLLAEDHDLVQRSTRHGPFRVFWLPVRVSTRRYARNGFFRQVGQYLKSAIEILSGTRITRAHPTYDYEFGEWEGRRAGRPRNRPGSS